MSRTCRWYLRSSASSTRRPLPTCSTNLLWRPAARAPGLRGSSSLELAVDRRVSWARVWRSCNHRVSDATILSPVASAKQARLAVNDLRTFYSKKVRSLEDQAREAQARATAAEKKLRESREKWASTKAKQTARLTYLERQAAQRDGKPGEMDRLRAELQVWTTRSPSFWRAFPS